MIDHGFSEFHQDPPFERFPRKRGKITEAIMVASATVVVLIIYCAGRLAGLGKAWLDD